MIKNLLQLLTRQKSRQVMVLYSGVILQTVLGVITSVIITRTLKPEQYGHYSYLTNLVNLVLMILSTGHFVSISMMLAQSENETKKRSLLGTSLLVSLILGLVFVLIIFVFSFFQDRFFHDKLGSTIRQLSIFVLFFPLQTYLENVLMGLNHIGSLSLQRVLPKVFYLTALFLFVRFGQLNYFSAFILLLLTSYIVYVFQVIRLKPAFTNIRKNLRLIESENNRYGFHVYLGALAGVATTYLCALSISYFANNKDLGFYNLALVVSGPLILLPNVVATTYFKNFANMNAIPKKLIIYTSGLALTTYILFVLLIKKVVLILYSVDYLPSVSLTYILGIAFIIHGFGDIFNRFLCAKAKGKSVRNGAFITGAVNVIVFLTIVPILSSTGAAITRLMVAVTYFMSMFIAYKNMRNNISLSATI
jgi:O-antigen/teichoic acid export membrane protein